MIPVVAYVVELCREKYWRLTVPNATPVFLADLRLPQY